MSRDHGSRFGVSSLRAKLVSHDDAAGDESLASVAAATAATSPTRRGSDERDALRRGDLRDNAAMAASMDDVVVDDVSGRATLAVAHCCVRRPCIGAGDLNGFPAILSSAVSVGLPCPAFKRNAGASAERRRATPDVTMPIVAALFFPDINDGEAGALPAAEEVHDEPWEPWESAGEMAMAMGLGNPSNEASSARRPTGVAGRSDERFGVVAVGAAAVVAGFGSAAALAVSMAG